MKNVYIKIIFGIMLGVIITLGYLLIRGSEGQKNYNCEECQELGVNKNYDCSFTKTYRVVNLLDNYVAEVPEWSYVVLDKFQMYEAYAHKISRDLKSKLVVGKYYEFTYHIVGTGNIRNMNDINELLVLDASLVLDNKLYVTMVINETNKVGLQQVQEEICQTF